MRKPITTAILAALIGAGGVLAPSAYMPAAAQGGTGTSKALAPKGTFTGSEAQLIEDYGSFALYAVDPAALGGAAKDVQVDPEADMLLFSAYPFDTQRGTLQPPAPFSLQPPAGASLRVLQFVGPVKQHWLDELAAHGVVPVQYVANNGYIVWADESAQAAIESLRSTSTWLQYAAPFYGFLKVDPSLGSQLSTNPASTDEVDVTVQVYAHDGVDATKQFVVSKGLVPPQSRAPVGSGLVDYHWSPILKFENLNLRVHLADVAAIAERNDVTFVGLNVPRKLMDEKQGIILTGDFAPGPASPSYLQFLLDHGFSQSAADYPIVDVTDSTIDEGGSGVTVLHTVDPFLHVQGDLAQPVRVSYFNNCSSMSDSQVGSYDGHGSLNAGIIADYDQSTGYPFQDADGQHLGLGINPFGRVGSTAIFVGSPESYDVSGCGDSDQGVIQSNWQTGARISTNSWGSTFPPTTYDSSDQAYDKGVRDADPSATGNQEMIYIFAAANSGPSAGSVSSPGAGKNVITVGASENLRPFPTPSDNQCGSDPAANPENVVGFSGRGPAPGSRAKPEVIAPGTHIQAAASVYSGYNGGGVCVKYYPESPAQQIFTYSSGTSHSTPAVAGVSSLAYWWIEQGGSGAAAGTLDEIGGARAPSPALMKAWLMAHPTYLTGTSANDNLPSNNQGYGMPNMTDMFDSTPKVLLDESEVFDNTGETRTYTWGIADPTKPVRIALAYTDAPGGLGTSPQVNNLDLKVEVGGQTYLGNHFDHQWSTTGGSADTKNNYEAVFLPDGVGGDMTITITATNIAGDGVPNSGDATDQDFALVCNNCAEQPTFTLTAPTAGIQVCAGSAATTPLQIGQITGFTDPVALSASGNPSGTTATFDPNPAVPPGLSTLTVGAGPDATPGDYDLTVTGTSGSITKTLGLDLDVYAVAPDAPSHESPADGTSGVSLTPTFSWDAADGAYSYVVQIATDAAFTNIVRVHETTDTFWTVGSGDSLDSSMRYWWRVVAKNPCGESGPAAPSADTIFADGFEAGPTLAGQEFTTLAQPGDCPVDASPTVLFSDDMESGAPGWTHGAASGSSDTWTLGTRANSGTHAWQANAPASGSANDQWLISPSVAIPTDLSGVTLKFWNQQNLKSNTGVCQDGAIVEISTDGGSNWTQLTDGLLTDPYDGTISGGFGNPLGGDRGWCGDPQAYLNSIVDIQSYAGQTVKFRFNVGHDRFPHRSGPNWAIDDVKVTGCSQ
ncbi:MAG TPA: S8 family serine peptidase [Dokdonella sp.]